MGGTPLSRPYDELRLFMLRRVAFVLVLACTACGGGAPRSNAADLLARSQPTPDPTLDAVVRDLPRALAGIPPTPTPTARPTVSAPKVVVKQIATPTPLPLPRKPTPSPTPARH